VYGATASLPLTPLWSAEGNFTFHCTVNRVHLFKTSQSGLFMEIIFIVSMILRMKVEYVDEMASFSF
jgi:hypothetical protein